MSFAYPYILWLLAALPIAAAFNMWVRRMKRKDAAAVLPSIAPLAHSPTTWRLAFRWVPGFLRFVSLAALIVALARPQESSGWTTTSTEGVAIQLVVDRSGSMSEPIDASPDGSTSAASRSKSEAAIDAITHFIAGDGKAGGLKGRMGDMIGLIAFARYADTLSPMARAHEPLVEAAKRIKPVPRDVPDEDGTAIGDALSLAAARLKRAEEEIQRQNTTAADSQAKPEFTIKSKVIVLMTDGQNNAGDTSPYDAANLAKQWGIRLYTIGVGAGERIVTRNTVFGPQQVRAGSGVDEQMLADIAHTTGGEYFSVSSETVLADAYAKIDQLEKSRIDATEHTKKMELFVPLAAASLGLVACELLLSATAFRRAA